MKSVDCSDFSNIFKTTCTLSTNTYYISLESNLKSASIHFCCIYVHLKIKEKKIVESPVYLTNFFYPGVFNTYFVSKWIYNQ